MHRAFLSKQKRLHVNEWIRIVAEEPQRGSLLMALHDESVSHREDAPPQEVWWPRLCANMGEVLNRTTHPLESRPSVAAFYKEALCTHPPPTKRDELITKAEALLGITESADVALVINMRQLPLLHAKFPWLRVRHWHDTDDTFSFAAFGNAYSLLFRDSMQEASRFCDPYRRGFEVDRVSFAHTRYGRIINATDDDELWSTTDVEAVSPAPPDAGAMPSVDVLLYTTWGTPASRILNRLSKSMWERPEYQHEWQAPGRRRELRYDSVSSPLEIVLAPLSLSEHLDTMRTPLNQTVWDLASHPTAAIAEIRDTLRTLAASDAAKEWTDVTQDAVVYKLEYDAPPAALDAVSDADAELYDLPGLSPDLAARVVTPISAQCVARALDAGHIASGRMAFVDARWNDVATLKDELWQKLYCTDNTDEAFATLAAATRGAHDIVFFCNHASTVSPGRATKFYAWLRRDGARVYGDALPRVRLLQGGMAALSRFIYRTHGASGRDTRFEVFDRGYK